MTCPRCGDTLEAYSLSGREAEICESCGYVGVSVAHDSERREVESWNEALERFYEDQSS